MDDRRRYDRATRHLSPPFAVVDLDAMLGNARDLLRRARGKPIRVASKSIRSLPVLKRILALDGVHGILAFTLPEALWLASRGLRDIVVAYPTADARALAELAGDPTAAREITVMVDCTSHLDLIEAAAAGAAPRHEIRVCIDIDTAYVTLGGRLRAGARRSPVRLPGQAAELAAEVAKRPGLRLVGLMAYEAQIAGVGDAPPGSPLYAQAIRWMQSRSRRELMVRRGMIVRAVREIADLEFVNGGGTGSVEKTVMEKAVTEVTAGSGFFHPRLFDFYRGFGGRPAALFALPVVRRPGPGVVTVLGGGYPASGPPSPSRLPQPYLPPGLSYDRDEGAGEVQTPLLGRAADVLRIGDRVWFRHAKAGELCERFGSLHLIEGEEIVETVPTYRGEGHAFL
ncbi:D-serine deaminase-like pyridoxal phosphate-dependent protein [Thermocatellispora tengchongensis]|uniref:D-serine deaminase-like pyridoxal phosphate-dependent protein n=1 Tax=Thermocatellispora tengchongensis TaxID=1073253 RepID=A0A840PF37_9ACTN|nr:amino acid deaminase/aldolase [Thermocatellispora tengchongensis]MBB5138208.1 D-serine deaminase-like pyridoxal phosphate-dependent protein [Thermocatellispora tengchongensis]